jgi:hypothetical protein
MPADHAEILKAAVQRFVAAHGRWPQSLDDLDPFGIRGFGTATVVGFEQATEEELCLRYVHKWGKAVVRIQRQPGNHD